MIKSIKKLVLIGYLVEYVDLREPKPRLHHEEMVVYDTDMIRAVEMLGLDVTDCIKKRFADGGYRVIQISRVGQKVNAAVDLEFLYSEATAEVEGGF